MKNFMAPRRLSGDGDASIVGRLSIRSYGRIGQPQEDRDLKKLLKKKAHPLLTTTMP